MARMALVVDDSEVVRKVARRLLDELGFDVAEAGDTAAALPACRASPPDLKLLDRLLPDGAGPDLLRRVRAEPTAQRARIIVMMTEADLGQITLALRSGASDVMLKPFDRASFRAQFDATGPNQAP